MTLPSVDMNGIDPEGNEPPDEVLYHTGDCEGVELVKREGVWQVRVWEGGDYLLDRYDDFADAFGAFSNAVGTEAGVWE